MSKVSQDVSRPGGFASRFASGNAGSTRPSIFSTHMLFGSLPKVGKSRLLGDCPEALVLNFDLAPFMPDTRAAVWPLRGEDGQTYEGGPGSLKKIKVPAFEDFMALRDDLLKAAAEDRDRPRIIVIDTITKMCNFVEDYLVRKSGKSDFRALGQDGWAERNRIVEGFGRSLYSAGYGLVELLHVAPIYIPVLNQKTGETVNEKQITPTVSKGLWQSLFVGPRLIASVELKPKTSMVDGKPRTVKSRVVRVAKSYLDSETGGTQIPIPDEIELSSEHPWDSFRSAFDEAVSKL